MSPLTHSTNSRIRWCYRPAAKSVLYDFSFCF